MANEVTGSDVHNAATRMMRATIAAALVNVPAYDPSRVNMQDAESMRAYTVQLNNAIDLVMNGIRGQTT